MEDFGHQSMHNEQNAMNIYKVNEWAEFRKEFQRLLPNIPIIDLYDALLSAIDNKLVIDIIALGSRLQNMYPEEWEYMSMKEIIIKHYGLEAMQLIESVL
jgi:hypothetical protein|nr:MAG TPA: hypothetical protein [Caudoviricetes sp.]